MIFFRTLKQQSILSFLGVPNTQLTAKKSNEAPKMNGSKDIRPKYKNGIQELNKFLTAKTFLSPLQQSSMIEAQSLKMIKNHFPSFDSIKKCTQI